MDQALGIIAPHPPIMIEAVGGERSEATSRSVSALDVAGRALEAFAPDVLVVSSPHAPTARDVFLVRAAGRVSGDLGQFGAPSAHHAASGDPEFARAIVTACTTAGTPCAILEDFTDPAPLDHGVLVPLSLLDPDGTIPIVVVSLSFLPYEAHIAFGRTIRAAAQELERRVGFLASGDLSHRLTREAPAGYSPRAQDFDDDLVHRVGTGDLGSLVDIDPALVAEAGECGLRSFLILSGFLEDSGTESRVLHYEAPWGVGYLTALAASPELLALANDTPPSGSKGGKPGDVESPPVALARRAIEAFVRDREVIDALPETGLTRRAGAFVSLHRGPDLRGCIGSIDPSTDSLAEEIVTMAIQAATQDPRFPSLDPEELSDLEISVDVLESPEPCEMSQLDPARYGVIVSKDWRRGLLLPDLDGVDTAEQQVDIARRKAGISPSESIRLERFRVDRFH